METKLLAYFSEELAYLRSGMKEFAQRYPALATQLHLNAGESEDPHVTRLLEGFALLCSRLRCQQDINFNQLNTALTEVLFPHYLAPIPSTVIVKFIPDEKLASIETIPRGTALETLPRYGEPLHFTNCYDTELLPLVVSGVVAKPDEKSILITISSIHPDILISQLDIMKLRFFINEPEGQGLLLYQHIMENIQSIQLITNHNVINTLGRDALSPVGFASQEALLPWPSIAAPASRLLIEYFTFKDKFLFFDFCLGNFVREKFSNSLQIKLQFQKNLPPSFHYLNTDSISLNCSPMINLVEKIIEPVLIDKQRIDYPLIVDKRHPDHYEIHTIEQVTDVTDPKNRQAVPGLYRQDNDNTSLYTWTAQRKYHTISSHDHSTSFIAIGDRTQQQDENKVLEIKATCFNGNLPTRIERKQTDHHLQFTNSAFTVKAISMLTHPTAVCRQNQLTTASPHAFLTARLLDNHLFFTNKDTTFQQIKSILSACDFKKSRENKSLIASIINLTTQQIVMRSSNKKLAPYIYGTKIVVTLNKSSFDSNSAFLFTNVLTKSFSRESDVNTRFEWEFVWEDI